MDGLIYPGVSLPALKHRESQELTCSCLYAIIPNILNYPSGSVPIHLIKEDEQIYFDSKQNDSIKKNAIKSLENSQGLPVGVLVSTLPFKEELCLNIMKQIEDGVNFHKYPL